jgi:hypothetical protein
MPLIHKKSKKAFGENIKREMDSGKPQKQAIAIAYSVKRKAKKASGGAVQSGSPDMNYAKGGEVSASNEKRPMPDNRYNDSKEVSSNSGNKPPGQDSWTSRPDKVSLKGRTYPLKHPKMVPTDSFSVRLRDEEDHLQDSAGVNDGPQRQPPEHDNELGPDRQGPEVPDMEREHSNRRRPYAKGGPIMQPKDHGDELMEREDEAHMQSQLEPSEDEGDMDAHSRNELDEMGHNSGRIDMEDEHSNDRKPYAMGGTASSPASRLDKGYGKVIVKEHDDMYAEGGLAHEMDEQPEEESELEHAASIAGAIMARRARMAEGGSIGDSDSLFHFPRDIKSHGSMDSDDSDQADLSRNADEDANEEDQASYNSLMKENYSESEGLDDLDYDTDRSVGHDLPDEDSHDMVSQIRKKIKKSPISR